VEQLKGVAVSRKGKKNHAGWVDENLKDAYQRWLDHSPISPGDAMELGMYLIMRLKPDALHEAYRAMQQDDPEFVVEGFRLAEGTTGQAHTEAERVVDEEVRRSRGGQARHTNADRGTG